jgi:hypothetical protein
MIEAERRRHLRQRDTKLFPISRLRISQLFDGSAEHVLDDHQIRVRRNDDALGRNRAVDDVRSLLV